MLIFPELPAKFKENQLNCFPLKQVGSVTNQPRRWGLDFSAMGGKRQRHGRALIGAGVTADARAKSRHRRAELLF